MLKNITALLVITCLLFVIDAKAQFTLPALSYSYQSLEPSIDSMTMRIHHDKHHQAYIDNLNKALTEEQKKLSIENILENVSKYNTTVRNNAGGHYNHSLFWTVLTPEKNTTPSKNLFAAITKQYGSIDSFKKLFVNAGLSQFGSGWVWLIVNSDRNLVITTTPNQDNPLMPDTKQTGYPILGIDLWEHAYYLRYQNKRAAYLNSIWDIVNWTEVSNRFEEANNILPKKR